MEQFNQLLAHFNYETIVMVCAISIVILLITISCLLSYKRGIEKGKALIIAELIAYKKTKNKAAAPSFINGTVSKVAPESIDEKIIKMAANVNRTQVGDSITLEYKGFIGSVEYNESKKNYVGYVQNVEGNPAYFGTDLNTLCYSFGIAVDKNEIRWNSRKIDKPA